MIVRAFAQESSDAFKPLEDVLHFDEKRGCLCLADGVTRTPPHGEAYPNPSLAQLAAEAATVSALNVLRDAGDPWRVLKLAFAQANRAVNQLALPDRHYNYRDNDLPGTVLTVVKLIGRQCFIGHLGDSTIAVLNKNGTINIETVSQTILIDQWAAAQVKFRSIADRLCYSRRNYRNNPSSRYGYGVLTGERAALSFVRYLRVDVAPGDILLAYSDGLKHMLGFRKGAEPLSPTIQNLLRQADAKLLITMSQEWSESRGLRNDDKTLAIFEP